MIRMNPLHTPASLSRRGKDEQDWSDLVVPCPPVYIQEKVRPPDAAVMRNAMFTKPCFTRLVLTLLLGLAASPTARAAGWKFVAVGDSRGSPQINTVILAEIARAITNITPRPEFVIFPGDLVNSGDVAAFREWTNILSPVCAAGIKVYPVIGNHDIAYGDSAYIGVLGPSIPDNGPVGEVNRTYSVVHSNALLLAMDTYVSPHRVNVAWMTTVLQTNTAAHVFVFGHDPAFKVSHPDCLDDYAANRNAMWSLMSNAAARVYFAGHDHFYDHMRVDDGDGDPSNDIHQMIVGTGGAPLYSYVGGYDGANAPYSPQRLLYESQYGFVVGEIDGPRATLTWHHRTGVDSYPATTDIFQCNLAPLLNCSLSGANLLFTWSGGGRLESAPAPQGPWTTLHTAQSPHIRAKGPGMEFFRVRLRFIGP